MKLVADESVDSGIILKLRQQSISVISISEEYSGIKDTDVLRISSEQQCLLITEDKDFGELTYRMKLLHSGILLIRLNDVKRKERIDLVVEAILGHFNKMTNNFSVLNKAGLRIKTKSAKL